jgi:hypothetical protein
VPRMRADGRGSAANRRILVMWSCRKRPWHFRGDSMSFGHHGAYSIAVFPGVIIVRAFSSWNEECARSYRAELAEKLAQASVSPFIHIIDQRSWDLATPEAMLLLAEDFPCPRPRASPRIPGARQSPAGGEPHRQAEHRRQPPEGQSLRLACRTDGCPERVSSRLRSRPNTGVPGRSGGIINVRIPQRRHGNRINPGFTEYLLYQLYRGDWLMAGPDYPEDR